MNLDQLVNKYKPHEVDFVFPVDKGDTSLYLDLSLLYESPDERWHKIQSLIYEYFNFYLKEYRLGAISETNLVDALIFPEVPYIALGYCRKGFWGGGGASKSAYSIKRVIFDDDSIREIGISAIAEMSIVVDKIGPDILSDMVANFGMHYLLDYTKEQVEIFGLETAEYQIGRALNVETMKWQPLPKVKLPYFENGEPRILVPRHLVRRLPVFSAMGFYKYFLRFILKQEENDKLGDIYRAIGKKPKISFKLVEAELKQKYGSLSAATRTIAKERPDIIKKYSEKPKLYEGLRKKRKKKEKIDWMKYIEELKNISGGKERAREYAELLRKIFTALYGEKLTNGNLEQKSLDSLFYYDIDFANGANTSLFNVIRNQGIKGGLLIIEAKNYDKTILGNSEFNQGLSYTISGARELIFLVSRDEISERDINRSRRHFLSHKVLIFPLGDADIINLINGRGKNESTFDEILIPRLKKILEA